MSPTSLDAAIHAVAVALVDRIRDETATALSPDPPSTVGKRKLTMDIARDIRRRYAAGEPGPSIARSLDISAPMVYRIINHQSWKEPT